MKIIKAVFLEKIYPKTQDEDDDFKIIKYMVTFEDKELEEPYEIIVKGFGIPEHKGVESTLFLDKKNTDEHGTSYNCKEFIVDIPKTKFAMKDLLVSKSRVFQKEKFEYMYKKYEDKLLFSLIFFLEAYKDEKMSEQNKMAIQDFRQYIFISFAKAILIGCGSLNVDPKAIVDKYGADTIKVFKLDPHKLVLDRYISFTTAENLLRHYGASKKTKNRFLSAGLEVIKRTEQGGRYVRISGNSCIKYGDAVDLFVRIIDLGDKKSIRSMSAKVFKELQEREKITAYEKDGEIYLYSHDGFCAETQLADNIKRFLSEGRTPIKSIYKMIQKKEVEYGFTLAKKQKEAIVEGLTNKITVITGGPGSGKTTIINFIRALMKERNKKANILLCAPTGMAARRMTESTGYIAYTMHSAMNIKPPEEGSYIEIEPHNKLSNYDAIIVDEFSMVDMYLADAFFRSVDTKKKIPTIIIIGDINQLPSVGAGNVLSDIIESTSVPTVKLDKVFRQSKESRIATNADLICGGHINLDFGDDFIMDEKNNNNDIVRSINEYYAYFVNQYGKDNVTVLSPFRTEKSATGVTSINPSLQNIANPIKRDSFKFYNKDFRVGDKVMQTKTKDGIANGDIGVITDIKMINGKYTITIDFGELGMVEYEKKDMKTVTLAYATTIHKSQGSEYQIVIMALTKEHDIMLKKNLVYTGITRAKKKVVIVGERSALNRAILRAEVKEDKRKTFLANRILEK